MYAVVETGGKQYKVSVGDKLKVEKLDVDAGSTIELDRVLMVANDGDLTLGTPLVDGTSVAATVLAQGRGEKIKVYKFKRRKKYRRTQGHRQSFTELEITSIGDVSAKKEDKKPAAKAQKPKKTEAKKSVKAKPKKVAKKATKKVTKKATKKVSKKVTKKVTKKAPAKATKAGKESASDKTAKETK